MCFKYAIMLSMVVLLSSPCVCAFVCLYICVFVCAFVHLCVFLCFVHLCVCIFVHLCVCAFSASCRAPEQHGLHGQPIQREADG